MKKQRKNSEIRTLLGLRIRELRKNKNLTQEQLANLINLDTRQIVNIEKGYSAPPLDTLEDISKALEIDFTDFFENKHLKSEKVLKNTCKKIIDGASKEKIKGIYLFLKNF